MSDSTIVKLAVSPRPTQPLTPSNKRKVVPFAESSSSNRVLIVTTSQKRPSIVQGEVRLDSFSTPKQLFPEKFAVLSDDYSNAHPSSENKPKEKETWHDRHIVLPYDLRDPGVYIENDEINALLSEIFPHTHNVTESRFRSHLIFQMDELPSAPWPQSIGGVPFTLHDFQGNGRALMFPRQSLGNSHISICEDGCDIVSFTDQALRGLGDSVARSFLENFPDVCPVELMLTNERTIYIVLEDHVDIPQLRSKLPGKIVRCPVGYINNRELCRPLWADLPGKRHIEPQSTPRIVDDTLYDTLRPGVLLTSDIMKQQGHLGSFSTTSGVLVEDRSHRKLMTGASHGIADGGNIWQGIHQARSIGKAATELPFTDISLVELEQDITFVNETFDEPGGNPPKLVRLATNDDKSKWGPCFLNSPFTGNMEASMVSKSVRLEKPSHPTTDQLRYVVYNWSYVGQIEGIPDLAHPPDGTSGSAIWDEGGIITGFYHYFVDEGQWKGFSVSVSASELSGAGYSLVRE